MISEIFITFLVGIIFLNRNDLKEIISIYKKIKNDLQYVEKEAKLFVNEIKNDIIHDKDDEVNYILGDDGKYYKSYNVEELNKYKEHGKI